MLSWMCDIFSAVLFLHVWTTSLSDFFSWFLTELWVLWNCGGAPHSCVYSSTDYVGCFLLSLQTLVKRSNPGCDESFWFLDEWLTRVCCSSFNLERSSLSFYLKEDLDWFPLCWHSCFSKSETLQRIKICWRELLCPRVMLLFAVLSLSVQRWSCVNTSHVLIQQHFIPPFVFYNLV